VQIGSTISPDTLINSNIDQQQQQVAEEDVTGTSSITLPGVTSTWFLTNNNTSTETYTALAPEALPAVVSTSKRLLALESLLGGNGELDVDVAWMVEREPALLTADPRAVATRLLELRIATEETADDVIQLIESQPALLLGKGCISREEGAEDKALAWRYGLMSDDAGEWRRHYAELLDYKTKYGDVHVGYRDGDNSELARWAAKQRAAAAASEAGRLSEDQRAALEEIGFEFKAETAEWTRWYNELKGFEEVHGHCSPVPLASGADFLLLNWCAVQRIAKRSRVLCREREELLEGIGFDWTGADALS
jgi:hypothetical protein